MKPPCRRDGKDCPDRGANFCHTADCPYGWGEYTKEREKLYNERKYAIEHHNIKSPHQKLCEKRNATRRRKR